MENPFFFEELPGTGDGFAFQETRDVRMMIDRRIRSDVGGTLPSEASFIKHEIECEGVCL